MQGGKQRAKQSAPAPGLISLTFMPGVADEYLAFEPSALAKLTSLETLTLVTVTKIKKGEAFQCPALRELCLDECHEDCKGAIQPGGLPSLTKLSFDREIDIEAFYQSKGSSQVDVASMIILSCKVHELRLEDSNTYFFSIFAEIKPWWTQNRMHSFNRRSKVDVMGSSLIGESLSV